MCAQIDACVRAAPLDAATIRAWPRAAQELVRHMSGGAIEDSWQELKVAETARAQENASREQRQGTNAGVVIATANL